MMGILALLGDQPGTVAPAPLPSLAAQRVLSLDGEWELRSSGGHHGLTGSVPGDLITDLETARVVQDPLYELGWLNNNTEAAPPWTAHVWTYTTRFTAPPGSSLVFDGIKMCAAVVINGKEALFATDQFLRYTVPVAGEVELDVVFDASKDTGGRYMASSGGWDFVPYTTTREGNISARNYSIPRTFSRGIWKSVYVSTGVAVLHVVPQILYTGRYATARLRDGAANFTVNTTVHIHAPSAMAIGMTVSVAGSSADIRKEVPAGESTVAVLLAVYGPTLWWPRGHGHGLATRYALDVVVRPSLGVQVNATRMVGFRTLALVTGNDTDEAFLERAATEEGSGNFTMFLRVNGEAVYTRGANMVPMDEFAGRTSDVRRLAPCDLAPQKGAVWAGVSAWAWPTAYLQVKHLIHRGPTVSSADQLSTNWRRHACRRTTGGW